MSKQQLVLKERLSLSLYDDEADRDTPSDTELQSLLDNSWRVLQSGGC